MKKKILMIDDDHDFVNALKIVLENVGYQCFEQYSTAGGIDIYLQVSPHLIILDVMLEDIASGFRLANDLRILENKIKKPHVPILMVSNVDSITELDFKARVGVDIPVDDFVNKPVEKELLIGKVQDLIRNGRAVV